MAMPQQGAGTGRAAGEPAVTVVPWESCEVDEIVDLLARSREHVGPWDPVRPETFYSRGTQQGVLDWARRARAADHDYLYGVRLPDAERREGRLVGRVTLSGVTRGAWENGHLGYFVDPEACGRGVATRAVGLVLADAFGPLGLHRVQASVMPRNAASRRVLVKLGFREEGYARRYLRIAGTWEDHLLYARLADEDTDEG